MVPGNLMCFGVFDVQCGKCIFACEDKCILIHINLNEKVMWWKVKKQPAQQIFGLHIYFGLPVRDVCWVHQF
jgi:(2Fe-2S) ferredoxin